MLAVKRTEGNLSFGEAMSLRYHLFHCGVCRNFVKQSGFIGAAIKKAYSEMQEKPPFILDDKRRDLIRGQMASEATGKKSDFL